MPEPGGAGIVDRHQDPRQALDHVIRRPVPDAPGFDVGVEAGKRATKRKAGCFRRAKIEAGAGRVLVGVDRLDELVELGPPIEGEDFGVGDPPGDLEIVSRSMMPRSAISIVSFSVCQAMFPPQPPTA